MVGSGRKGARRGVVKVKRSNVAAARYARARAAARMVRGGNGARMLGWRGLRVGRRLIFPNLVMNPGVLPRGARAMYRRMYRPYRRQRRTAFGRPKIRRHTEL